MKRRDFLLAVGAVATLPLLARVAHDAWNRVATAYPPADGLSEGHLALVSAVADVIIPRTDTPGATDVGVPAWINVFVAGHYTSAERAMFIGGLDAIDALATDTNGTALALNSPAQRERVIVVLDRPNAYERFVARLEHSPRFARAMSHVLDHSTLERLMTPLAQRARAYSRLKALVVHGYFTSEHVHKEVLKAEIMPGRFDGGTAHLPMTCPGSTGMTRATTYDAIVVGSGISGGWAAKELCERGLRTLVLEAGPPIGVEDFVEHVQAHEMPFRGLGNRHALDRDQPIQRKHPACDELAHKFFVNDNENPYTNPKEAPFHWIRGRQVGGRSIMWGRQVYRWSDLDFEANARDGHGNDWPIRYADIAPWYTHVERFIGVSGAKEGIAHLPDGDFLPPMAMTVVEQHAREKINAAFGNERIMTIGRSAVLTKNHNGRLACHYCGPCHRGCETHSFFNSIGSTLPAARNTGKLALRPNSVVAEVLYDSKRGRARGVRVIDAQTLQETEFEARVIFLCASAIESTRILLNSRSASFTDGLGNSSGMLGRYLMDHHFGSGASGHMPGFSDKRTIGMRPNGTYIARFRNVTTQHPDFLRGYGIEGRSFRAGWTRGRSMPGYGAEFKQSLIEDLGEWTISTMPFGETLPHEDNRVTLDPIVKDKWGIPAARIDVRWRENERAMDKDMMTGAAEMLEAAGCKDVHAYLAQQPPGHCVHEMGGARMSRTPEDGVLNKWNQAWDAKNLFVTDGACMASSACQNPSITYMALTARATAHAVDEMKRGTL